MALVKLLKMTDNSTKEFDDVTKVIIRNSQGSIEITDAIDMLDYLNDPDVKSIAVHRQNGTVSKFPMDIWRITTIKN
ncbi:hypothetical protein ACWN8V_09055 [Vagococcus elongatus]|uniref:Uncharacterized protein n=1 Tax=Vagococcus elongatus TaxID=180344 RepID=A0A430ASK7_9ENTE|nr:hypothetical protein [Vagococcus elongatus]RSU11049.1 hypothetical protein CBF29_08795 [Vagococcus elongatus]